jgi:hypothetical protein
MIYYRVTTFSHWFLSWARWIKSTQSEDTFQYYHSIYAYISQVIFSFGIFYENLILVYLLIHATLLPVFFSLQKSAATSYIFLRNKYTCISTPVSIFSWQVFFRCIACSWSSVVKYIKCNLIFLPFSTETSSHFTKALSAKTALRNCYSYWLSWILATWGQSFNWNIRFIVCTTVNSVKKTNT